MGLSKLRGSGSSGVFGYKEEKAPPSEKSRASTSTTVRPLPSWNPSCWAGGSWSSLESRHSCTQGKRGHWPTRNDLTPRGVGVP